MGLGRWERVGVGGSGVVVRCGGGEVGVSGSACGREHATMQTRPLTHRSAGDVRQHLAAHGNETRPPPLPTPTAFHKEVDEARPTIPKPDATRLLCTLRQQYLALPGTSWRTLDVDPHLYPRLLYLIVPKINIQRGPCKSVTTHSSDLIHFLSTRGRCSSNMNCYPCR